jgi:nucleoside-diphosphate-sugar epimerase
MTAAECQKIIDMASASDVGAILVTGACGHIGREVCRVLSNADRRILPVDLDHDETRDVLRCDLRSKSGVSQLFQAYPIREVIHLAGILPSAFQADPLTGAVVNTLDLTSEQCTGTSAEKVHNQFTLF